MSTNTALLAILIILLFVYVARSCMHTYREKNIDSPRMRSYYFPVSVSDSVSDSRESCATIGFLAGVHGNEPAGATTLQALVDSGWFAHAANEYRVNIVVVPRANESGLRKGVRWTGNFMHHDLNRSFTSERGDGVLAGELLHAFAQADIVIDFHEGWGWHRITPASIGSTVSPTQTESRISDAVARKIIDNLNADISDPDYAFTFLPHISCDIRSTLSCHMEKAGREYILIETTGQKNIQPLHVRAEQIKKSIATALIQVSR